MTTQMQEDMFIAALTECGRSADDSKLCEQLGWTRETYAAVKQRLMDQGKVAPGMALGGSVRLLEPSEKAATPDDGTGDATSEDAPEVIEDEGKSGAAPDGEALGAGEASEGGAHETDNMGEEGTAEASPEAPADVGGTDESEQVALAPSPADPGQEPEASTGAAEPVDEVASADESEAGAVPLPPTGGQNKSVVAEDPGRLELHWDIAAKVNFACYQNAFPILRDMRVDNPDPEQPLEDIRLQLSSDSGFLNEKTWHVGRLAAGAAWSASDRDIDLNGEHLRSLPDTTRSEVTLRAYDGDRLLKEETRSVGLLAAHEWGGAGYMPELLAAFSMPNQPMVDRILHAASMKLREGGRPDHIDGYTSKRRDRVWEIASAIYAAIADMGLTYALHPASFERDGQKIRTPEMLLDGKVATCLDTTMLFCSVLEQAGLNPIVAMPEGHAVAGVWLQPMGLPTIVIEDAETLRKRIEMKELILIETTFVTQHPTPPFSEALERARTHITQEDDESFNAAVDIKLARAHRIHPIALEASEASGDGEDSPPVPTVTAMQSAPPLPSFDEGVAEEEKPATPEGRLDRWLKKLLELSTRNPLLSHRATKTSLKLICPDPALLEDKLADGAQISLASVPQPSSEGQDEDIHRVRTGEGITEEYARDALDRQQVLVDLPQEELDRRAVGIYRKARGSLQEGGSNTLYLALGFLLWKRENDDRRYRAPLILVPVQLTRRSARSGIKMSLHDDEPRFNTTLLEKLRRDEELVIDGLDDELPKDKSGIDVRGVWDIVRREIVDLQGFEVVEDVVLGHFSFAKYLMWKDLQDRVDALRRNAVVRHLIDTPSDPYGSTIEPVAPRAIDRDFAPSDLLAPLPADSSQMAAIATADRGKDFIIIGPPGTGKSQTISNMIAHLLGQGKTVLFLSEKTAALEVVHRRLEEIGLGRFCLELHSNKARKADVLKQLGDSWDADLESTESVWKEQAKRLGRLRGQLNDVVDHIHQPYPNGLTPYYAMGVKIRDEEKAKRLRFAWANSNQHSEEQRREMKDAVEKLKRRAEEVEGFTGTPLGIVSKTEWSPIWEDELMARANSMEKAALALGQAVKELERSLSVRLPNLTLARLKGVASLAYSLRDSHRRPALSHAIGSEGVEWLERSYGALGCFKRYGELHGALSCPYDPMAWRELNGEQLTREWREAESSWFLKAFFAKGAIVKKMRLGGAQGTPIPGQDAPVLASLREEGQKVEKFGASLSGLPEWDGFDTDLRSLKKAVRTGRRMRAAVTRLAEDTSALLEMRSQLQKIVEHGNDLLASGGQVGAPVAACIEAFEELLREARSFAKQAGASVGDVFAAAADEEALEAIQRLAKGVTDHRGELRRWCAWLEARQEAVALDLQLLIDSVESGATPVDELEETFEAAYCTWWSSLIIGEDPVLRTFSSSEHTNLVDQFRDLDERFQRVTAEHIAATLSGSAPGKDTVRGGSGWGIVRRLLGQSRPRMPIRQIIKQAPEAVATLTPCLMMSPLSVAQYLPADQALFDVVIFDEASQITVWDAVGSIARGKQTIIAGDPKQMPPTNFFSRAADTDGLDEHHLEDDLESILDELKSAGIPEMPLNLHYRSQRESLIAFSNFHYYDQSLVTFPAPVHPDTAVSWVPCDGHYARGGARNNQGEANAIVSEIVRRLTSRDEAVRRRSIGVVTFNTEQQTLILQLLDEARRSHPEIEWAFRDDAVEPVFVKNLETVQGDERDVILFSVTYGPDVTGQVTMNFGPLNKQGGERRLNVAITRARMEMVIYSTIRPSQIDLGRTGARAVQDLKHFLEYAEQGPGVLGTGARGSVGDFESPFEAAVARELRAKGWELHPQIGVSRYRVDIGIVHPDRRGDYLAGVECDGAMYHSSAYARERDKIREQVLNRLGWTLFRVWSTDWWVNKSDALEKLHRQLESHLEEDRRKRAAAEEAASRQAREEAEAPSPPPAEPEEEVADQDEPSDAPSDSESSAPEGEAARSDHPPPTVPEDQEDGRYIRADLSHPSFAPAAQRFYDEDYEASLVPMIDHVIDTEGPIHEDVLVDRIARHHGFQRSGKNIRGVICGLAPNRRGTTTEGVGKFYWRKGTVKERICLARYAERDEELRSMEYICEDEIRAIDEAVGSNGDLVALARALGIGRLSRQARQRLEEALGIGQEGGDDQPPPDPSGPPPE